jgi:hypothetical protein
LAAQVILEHRLKLAVEVPQLDDVLSVACILLKGYVAFDFVQYDDRRVVNLSPQLAQSARAQVLDLGVSVFYAE